MSTSFYPLRAPITSVRIEHMPGAAHSRLVIFVNGANAGKLTLRIEELTDMVRALASGVVAVTRSNGQLEVRPNAGRMVSYTQLVDEYGGLWTYGDLKASLCRAP